LHANGTRSCSPHRRHIGKSIPTLQLEYARPQIGSTVVEVALPDLENLPVGLDGGAYRLEDLDGEGVPGVLTEQAGALYFKRRLGDAHFGPMRVVESLARGMSLSGGAQLMDLDGAGGRKARDQLLARAGGPSQSRPSLARRDPVAA